MNKKEINVEEELTKILSESLAKEIDIQIVASLKPYIRQAKIESILKKIDEKKKTD